MNSLIGIGTIVTGLFLFFIISIIGGSFFIVTPTKRYIIERLGRYQRTAQPGLNFKMPFIDKIAKKIYIPLKALAIEADCKSQDNVYSTVHLTVQYQPMPGRESDAYYKIDDEEGQMKAYVFDATRSQTAIMPFSEFYSHKDALALAAKQHVAPVMEEFGWKVVNVLVTDIVPDKGVRDALQQVRTQQLLREAAKEKGEGNKVLTVKDAEALSESKKLQGTGIANEQMEIALGFKARIEMLKDITGENPREIMQTLLLTQYFDTLKALGTGAASRVLFLPSGPDGMDTIMNQITKAMETKV